ncbi:hypothetical protein DICSQDRAFT_170202 [Dichomitus squalens LYAD-421 SS1]|uniref:SET domain-containing protein n=1 Tax=Dichomitus squalens (strain LYAD-421) TaxID=732165 RepID=R7T2C5_DICSQ|nr:uncharacterized protein DICSQDRAFT_170202 [Dichomitus squalens LYAD-421 SS1]EJF61452.1 hypothetical protein DICSQDRAFT_170202 [Dichomitus squalens LYAD-421 SS1]
MSSQIEPDAEAAKQRGNELFAAQDYEGAIKSYSESMKLDPSQWTYPLNRCFAHLKLERWTEAEADATSVIDLDESNAKAWYRRSLARKGLGKSASARADLYSYGRRTRDFKIVVEENSKIAAMEAAIVKASVDSPACGFKFVDTSNHGVGAFATRSFERSELVLVEEPLYTVSEIASPRQIAAAVSRLTDDERTELSLLHNNFPDRFDDSFVGIHRTNAFAAGEDSSVLCLRGSRFNHSCTPNARYSWYAPSKTFRIYALRSISEDEEILVSYISGRNIYGSSKAQRQARLQSMLGFVYSCTSCTLPSAEQAASDRRRQELTQLWDTVPHFPPSQTAARLNAIARAIRLMKEEGYDADEDDFTNDAAVICAFHSDWESAVYWGIRTYESRVAEFGADSRRAMDEEVLRFLLEPQKHQMAGRGTRKVFKTRV